MALVATARGLFEVAPDVRATPEAAAFEDRDVTAVASGGGATWAIVDGSEVWRGEGGSWERVAAEGRLKLRCVGVSREEVLVGTSEAHLLRLTGGALERVASFDDVEGRDGWYTPWGGPPDTRSLSAGPDGPIYANVHVGGIPASRDGGGSWSATIDVDSDVHQVLAHPERAGVVLAATAFGLAVSEDAGGSWSFLTEGVHGEYMRAVAVSGDAVVVSASEGHIGRDARLYRTTLGSDEFEPCAGLPERWSSNVDTGWLLATDGAFIVATPDAEVYVSRDDGATWSHIAHGLPPVRWLAA